MSFHPSWHLCDLMADEMWREKITYTPLWSHDDDGSSEIRGGKRLRLLPLAGLVGQALRSHSPGAQCRKQRYKHPVGSETGRFDGGIGEGEDVEVWLLFGCLFPRVSEVSTNNIAATLSSFISQGYIQN